MKWLCKIFGHSDRKHYHKKTDYIWCLGGCEKFEDVFKVLPCPRCGVDKV